MLHALCIHYSLALEATPTYSNVIRLSWVNSCRHILHFSTQPLDLPLPPSYSSTLSILRLLGCMFHRFPPRQLRAGWWWGWGGATNRAAHGENRLLLLPVTFGQRKRSETYSVLLVLSPFPSAEVFLQRHGGRAAGFPQVPAPAQTQAPAACHGENGGGHQHAHLQRPQTARKRDHGLNWEPHSLSQRLSSREELCRDTGEKGQGKWWRGGCS